MSFLHGLGAGAVRRAARIARAFEEEYPRDRGKSLQILQRIDHRLVDHSVDQKPVRARVDGGNAGMMTFIMQARRRDDAAEGLQWRKAVRSRRGRLAQHRLELRTQAIPAIGTGWPAGSAPGGIEHRPFGSARRRGGLGTRGRERRHSGGSSQKPAALQDRPAIRPRKHAILAGAILLWRSAAPSLAGLGTATLSVRLVHIGPLVRWACRPCAMYRVSDTVARQAALRRHSFTISQTGPSCLG